MTRCYACGGPACTRCRLAWAGCVVAVAVAAVALLDGCGASQATRAAYGVEAARCMANEREIETRVGTTREEDLEDLELERARCSEALRRIEAGE
jgi:hypothetical protein